jgi:heterodisulfide reductase subunit C
MEDAKLKDAFFNMTSGERILTCIQCGTCSASCPLTDRMDHAPRELFALIRDGDMQAVLISNTPWYCVSCYQCAVRCPREIPVSDLMYTLKQMATDQRMAPKANKLPRFYQIFAGELERHGRITGAMLLARYGLRYPKDMLSKFSLGFKLLTKRRLEFPPRKIGNPKSVRDLLTRQKRGETQ